jgi:hypothetical protein
MLALEALLKKTEPSTEIVYPVPRNLFARQKLTRQLWRRERGFSSCNQSMMKDMWILLFETDKPTRLGFVACFETEHPFWASVSLICLLVPVFSAASIPITEAEETIVDLALRIRSMR